MSLAGGEMIVDIKTIEQNGVISLMDAPYVAMLAQH